MACGPCGSGKTPTTALGQALDPTAATTGGAEALAYTNSWGTQLKDGTLLVGPGYVEAIRLVRCRGGQLVDISAEQMAQLAALGAAEPAEC